MYSTPLSANSLHILLNETFWENDKTQPVWLLEKGGHFSRVQYRFRRSRSSTDALVQLEANICQAFARKQQLVSLFFDLRKAYDTTWGYGILRVLHSIGIRGNLTLFIRSFFQDRTFRIRVGISLSCPCLQEKGVPQGSVSSTSLFGLAINNITKSAQRYP